MRPKTMTRSPAAAFLTSWIEATLDAKSPRTRAGYVWVARRFYAFLEARTFPLEIADLRPLHVRAFYAATRAEGASANTLANFDRTLRAIFSRIEREGREDFDLPATWRSPFAAVEKLKPRRAEKVPLSAEQAQRLLRSMPRAGFVAYRNYAQLAFMLMTGARSIEVRHLEVADVLLAQGIVSLRVTKGGKPRIVYMPARLVRLLAGYLRRRERKVPAPSTLVFPTRAGAMQSSRALHRAVRRAGQRIGFEDLGPHRLRHSYVTLSHAKGAPLKFLQEQCGHSSVLVTQGYISLSAGQKAELANQFAAC